MRGKRQQHTKQGWTEEEGRQLQRMRDIDKMRFTDIARELGRTVGACYAKYDSLLNAEVVHGQPEPGARVNVTPEQIADRDARDQLRYLQSPAAALMGEPLPGRSALDLRRQSEAQ